MKIRTKAKWIVGLSGVAVSAFVIGQLDGATPESSSSDNTGTEITSTMSERERELVQLDWSNFTVQVANEGNERSDRTTRRT